MTSVSFYRQGQEFIGFSLEGHAGYAAEGQDIVCASITTAAQMAANGVTDVLLIPAKVSVGPEASLSLELPPPPALTAEQIAGAQTLLASLLLQLRCVEEQFPDFLKTYVLEVANK